MSAKSRHDFNQDLSIDRFIEEFASEGQNAERLREAEMRLDLSEFMKGLRKKCRLTQTEFAKRVGKTQPLIAKLEAGAYDRMGFSGTRTYARALGFDFVGMQQMFRPIEEEAAARIDNALSSANQVTWPQRSGSFADAFADVDPAEQLVAA